MTHEWVLLACFRLTPEQIEMVREAGRGDEVQFRVSSANELADITVACRNCAIEANQFVLDADDCPGHPLNVLIKGRQ